jgi:hypothetical protein
MKEDPGVFFQRTCPIFGKRPDKGDKGADKDRRKMGVRNRSLLKLRKNPGSL